MPKISELPESYEITGTERFALVQEGETRKASIDTLIARVSPVNRLANPRWTQQSTAPEMLNETSIAVAAAPVTLHAFVESASDEKHFVHWEVTYTDLNALLESVDNAFLGSISFRWFEPQTIIPESGSLLLTPGRWKVVAEAGDFNAFGGVIDINLGKTGFLTQIANLNQEVIIDIPPGQTDTVIARQDFSHFDADISVYQVGKYPELPWTGEMQPFGPWLSIHLAAMPQNNGVFNVLARLYHNNAIVDSSGLIFASCQPNP